MGTFLRTCVFNYLLKLEIPTIRDLQEVILNSRIFITQPKVKSHIFVLLPPFGADTQTGSKEVRAARCPEQ